MNQIDLTKIILTKKEFKFLKQFKDGKHVKIDSNDAHPLTKYGLIEPSCFTENRASHWDGTYEISDNGCKYLEYITAKRHKETGSEIRGWITAVIAVIALLKSFSAEIHGLLQGVAKLLRL